MNKLSRNTELDFRQELREFVVFFRTKEEEGGAKRKLFLINQNDTLDSSEDEENFTSLMK